MTTLLHLTLPNLTLLYLTWPNLTLLSLALPHLTISYLPSILPYLTFHNSIWAAKGQPRDKLRLEKYLFTCLYPGNPICCATHLHLCLHHCDIDDICTGVKSTYSLYMVCLLFFFPISLSTYLFIYLLIFTYHDFLSLYFENGWYFYMAVLNILFFFFLFICVYLPISLPITICPYFLLAVSIHWS